MTTAHNKTITRNLVAAINSADETAFLQLVAPDVIDHYAPPGLPPGREGWNINRKLFRAAFPDGRWTEEDLVAEGDRVVGRYFFTGTHQGEFMGIPPTGRQVAVSNIHIVRIYDGIVVEHWGHGDDLGMMQTLGAIPVPESSSL